MKRARFYLKAAIAVILVSGLGVAAALVAVKVFFPEPRARAWFVNAARRQLGRDVRLERIDIGLRGLSLRGFEVSERPDFPAIILKINVFTRHAVDAPVHKIIIAQVVMVAPCSSTTPQDQIIVVNPAVDASE